MILKSVEKEFWLELGQDDNLCTADQSSKYDDHFAVDVKERQNAEECLLPFAVIQRIA